MKWKEDQERLAEAFKGRRVIAEPVSALNHIELAVAQETVACMRGTVLIADCFQALVLTSFSNDRSVTKIMNLPQLSLFLSGFRTLRASYKVFLNGYYFEAAGHLRSLVENVHVLAAFAKGKIDQDGLFGDKISGAAAIAVAGKGSSLSEEDIQELKDLKELLGMHIHGSQPVTATLMAHALDGTRLPSAEPYFDKDEASHYGGLSICLSWPMLRLWRALPDAPVGPEWDAKYNALDAAMRSFVQGWNKPAADAIARWVDKELDFAGVPIRLPTGVTRKVPFKRQ